MSNLRLLNETSVTSGVASVSVTDVFTDDFDVYKVVFTDMEIQTEGYNEMRFINSSGSIVSTGLYENAVEGIYSFTFYNQLRGTGDTKIEYLTYLYPNSYDDGNGNVLYIFNPSNPLSYTHVIHQGSGMANTVGFYNFKGIGVLKEPSNITGFQLFRTGNINNLKLKVYGIRVDA
tara:strand:- start:305 stop:829 length:525 start_codon:yes stop_codon:yes gene_type:complete